MHIHLVIIIDRSGELLTIHSAHAYTYCMCTQTACIVQLADILNDIPCICMQRTHAIECARHISASKDNNEFRQVN